MVRLRPGFSHAPAALGYYTRVLAAGHWFVASFTYCLNIDMGLMHVGPLSYCATMGSILPIAFLGGQNGHMFMNSRRYNARLLG